MGIPIRPRFIPLEPRAALHLARATALAAAIASVADCAAPPRAGYELSGETVTPRFLEHRNATDAALAADTLGHVALTWVTRDDDGARDLWNAVSLDGGSTFAAPVRLNARAGSVSSYSESRPIPVWGPGGALAVAWTAKRPVAPLAHAAAANHKDAPAAADLVVRVSGDAGATFEPEVVVNDDVLDGKRVFHGFPALTWLADGTLFAAWDDEREHAGEAGEPTSASLFYAVSHDNGAHWSDNQSLTDQLCPCCRAAVALDPAGRIAVTWRTARNNLRDPVIAFSSDGGRTFAPESTVSADRWAIEGCPSVGPALAFDRDGGGAYAWLTGADSAGVYFKTWRAGGAASAKRSLDDGVAGATHPRVALLDGATLFAVEATPRGGGVKIHSLAVRAVMADGTKLPWSFLGENVDAGWLTATGPRTALACWTDRGAHVVRVARLTLHKVR